jgi:hypothetical protein
MSAWVCVDQDVADAVGIPWALDRIGLRNPWHHARAIMLFDDDELRMVAAFTDYNGISVGMHIASEGKMHRGEDVRNFVRVCFRYVFEQLKVRRAMGLIASSNPDCVRLALRLGFKVEGRMREAADDGSDLVMMGMLKRECQHLEREDDGRPIRRQPECAACA